MKAYIITMGKGEYDEYYEDLKYFANKEKAEQFAKEYDKQIEFEKQEIEKCKNCKYKKLNKDVYSLISVFPECYEKYDFNYEFGCKYMKHDNEKHFAEIQEIEIEE